MSKGSMAGTVAMLAAAAALAPRLEEEGGNLRRWGRVRAQTRGIKARRSGGRGGQGGRRK